MYCPPFAKIVRVAKLCAWRETSGYGRHQTATGITTGIALLQAIAYDVDDGHTDGQAMKSYVHVLLSINVPMRQAQLSFEHRPFLPDSPEEVLS